jgi:RNA polymerase sigma factor (sigma-70 family)
LRHDRRVPEESDLELVERFRRTRDDAGFEELVRRHRPWVVRVCARLLRADAAAQDAAQEVFLRAVDRLDSFRGDNFAGWLKAIAVNCCLNTIDREKRWAPLEAAGAPAAETPGAEDRLVQSERAAQVARLIARLPPKQKIVFCMKYIDGCSYQEIERLTGFTGNEVKSFLQNARRNVENWWRAAEGSGWTTTRSDR